MNLAVKGFPILLLKAVIFLPGECARLASCDLSFDAEKTEGVQAFTYYGNWATVAITTYT